MEQGIIRSHCGLCHGACGILAHVVDSKLVKVEGDPGCTVSKGALCPIGLAATQLVYHPDRIKYPMKRVGQRGQGQWVRISWEEALDTIAERIKEIRERYGSLAVALAAGTGRPHTWHVRRFMNFWDTPNRIGMAHFCYAPLMVTGNLTYGRPPWADMENSRCIVNWGANPTNGGTARHGRTFINGLKGGAKLICVDPYLTPIASKSDIWLQIRPGTDCAMALAWLNVILSERLYDRGFVENWTYGFDELAKHVEEFTPEWAERITWVKAAKIQEAARMYATTKPASIFPRVSVEMGINTTNTTRCIHLLPAVTGNIDVPGGNVLWDEAMRGDILRSFDDAVPGTWDKALGDFPLLNMREPIAGHAGWRAVLTEKPYPFKSELFHGSNAVVEQENPKGQVYPAMMKLEFISVMDIFWTPTTELADIVLPASTPFERDNIIPLDRWVYAPPTLCALPKVIEPLWESRDDQEAFRDILQRVGLDWKAETNRERINQMCLRSEGISFEALTERSCITSPIRWKRYEQGLLREDKAPGFNTPSGKVELYSKQLEGMGLDPLPLYLEPPESPVSSPEMAESYPLILTTGLRSPVFFHTQYRQLPWLREIHPDPILRLNPETAERFGIKNDDWVYIESPRGRCKQKAVLTIGIDPRVVLAESAWWFPEMPAPEHGAWESNINVLVDSEPPYDPGFGSTPVRSLLCKIYKAKEV